MNMVDYTKHYCLGFDVIEEARYGVNVIGSEIIGLVPMAAIR